MQLAQAYLSGSIRGEVSIQNCVISMWEGMNGLPERCDGVVVLWELELKGKMELDVAGFIEKTLPGFHRISLSFSLSC